MDPNQKKIIQDLSKAAFNGNLALDLLQELLILLVEKKLIEKREIKNIYEKLTKNK
jgi:uncharacterized coiled-coil protein SlyX